MSNSGAVHEAYGLIFDGSGEKEENLYIIFLFYFFLQ